MAAEQDRVIVVAAQFFQADLAAVVLATEVLTVNDQPEMELLVKDILEDGDITAELAQQVNYNHNLVFVYTVVAVVAALAKKEFHDLVGEQMPKAEMVLHQQFKEPLHNILVVVVVVDCMVQATTTVVPVIQEAKAAADFVQAEARKLVIMVEMVLAEVALA